MLRWFVCIAAGFARVLSIILRPIIAALEAIIALLVAMLVVVAFLQVVLRYGFHSSLFWAEEFIRFNFTWVILLSAAYATEKHAHFAVEAVSWFLPATVERLRGIFVCGVIVAVSVFFVIVGLRFSMDNWIQQSLVVRVPMTIVYVSIPVAATIMLLASVRDLMTILGRVSKG